MATKEELLKKAKELDIEGRSSMDKDELEKAVANAEGSSGEGKDSAASDATNPEVQENLSPSGQDALEEMGEDSESAKLADVALDASGPLHLQAPSDRIMTGAANEEQAKEFEKALADKPDDYVGDVSEAGFTEPTPERRGAPKDNLSPNDERSPEDVYEVRAEHVIDFPPTLAEREERATGEKVKGDETVQSSASGAFHNEPLGSASQSGSRSRLFEQKSVFYTDGLSGEADMNHERAYNTPEKLQSNDPVVRASGDESESEALKAEKEEQLSDNDKRQAERVKSGDVAEETEQGRKG